MRTSRMLPALRTPITICFVPFLLVIGCDYAPPAVEAIDNPENYSASRSAVCGMGNVECGGLDVCCIDLTDMKNDVCRAPQACKNTPIGCDDAQDCTLQTVCCGQRNVMDGPVLRTGCVAACQQPDVRMCRIGQNPSSCLLGSVCAQLPGLPPGTGSCQPQ